MIGLCEDHGIGRILTKHKDSHLVDDDVHVLVLVCSGLEVEHDAGVAVDHGALWQNGDLHRLSLGHDLGHQSDVHLETEMLSLVN